MNTRDMNRQKNISDSPLYMDRHCRKWLVIPIYELHLHARLLENLISSSLPLSPCHCLDFQTVWSSPGFLFLFSFSPLHILHRLNDIRKGGANSINQEVMQDSSYFGAASERFIAQALSRHDAGSRRPNRSCPFPCPSARVPPLGQTAGVKWPARNYTLLFFSQKNELRTSWDAASLSETPIRKEKLVM